MKPSLRRKLLRHVLLPLCLTWALGTSVAVALSYYFASSSFDRALLDDAYALSAQIQRNDNGEPRFDLSEAEISAVLFDQTEQVFFSIWRADGALLAGHAGLKPKSDLTAQTFKALTGFEASDAVAGKLNPSWAEASYNGRSVRLVTMPRIYPIPHVVVVAQTMNSRNEMLRQLMVWSILPQVLLLVLVAFWMARKLRQDLSPLQQLRDNLEARPTHDLSAMPHLLAAGANTRDVEHLGLAMNGLFARLNTSWQAQREFTGNAAHELKTPIAVIRLQAEALLNQALDEASKTQVKKLLESTDRASRLIAQLLALAYADEASDSVAMEELDVVALVVEALERHLPKADKLGVDLGVDVPEHAVWVQGSRLLLDAVLDNLIDNAMRYGRPKDGSATLTLQVKLRQEKQRQQRQQAPQVWLSVTDNGEGLSPEQTKRMTQRWEQAAKRQSLPTSVGVEKKADKGTGLGLAIVSRYCALMQASFELLPTSQTDTGLSARIGLKAPSG